MLSFLRPSSSSRMRFMNHNWSAMKQHLHPPSVAEISHHSIFYILHAETVAQSFSLLVGRFLLQQKCYI